MSTLKQRILDRIEQHGPIPFAAYMSLALYDQRDGYYARHPRTGWGGHFVTSPEIDPAFGSLCVRLIEQVWTRGGKPKRFDLIEIGPGEGGFARSVLDAAENDLARALHFTLVEQSPTVRQRQAERLEGDPRVAWVASLDEARPVTAGCVFANEVLDNLPVHIVEMTEHGLAEVFVSAQDGELVEELGSLSTPALEAFVARHRLALPRGHRLEVPLALSGFVRRATAFVQAGALVFIDYGALSDELLLHPAGTLTSYSPGGADAEPLVDPGRKDITAHVNWNAVLDDLEKAGATTTGPLAQNAFLRALGAADIDESLHEAHEAALKDGRGIDAVAALSRRNALRVLLDPGGLGALQVVIGWRGIRPIAELA